ncbi:MAG: DNA repair protein RecO, partial [Candidatus Adiutrix sp.]
MHRFSGQKKTKRLAAVVLKRTNYGEADLIVTFLTREMGLINGLARYGRRSLKRFGGGLLSLGVSAWYDFTFKPHTSLAFVEKGEENPHAPRLPADPVWQGLGAYALELVFGFETHNNPAAETFDLLVRHLGRLSRSSDEMGARRVSLDFALAYLELAGFGPRFDSCLVCGDETNNRLGWRWDPLAGGIFCPLCPDSQGKDVRQIRPNLFHLLCLRQKAPLPLTKDDL